MKVTKSAMMQCMILILVLAAEIYYMRHDAPVEEQIIPDSLIEAMKRAWEEEGTEKELFTSLKTGRELSESEIQTVAVKNADVSRLLEMDDVKMTGVDLDNDGWEDIYAKVDFGGTGGYGEYLLYQGNGAGEYKRTGLGTEEYVRKEFYVICWEGKNYACHWKGAPGVYGWIVEGYRDGELVETVSLNRVPGKRTESIVFCQDGYRDMAEKELKKAPEIYDQTKDEIVSEGDAEQREESKERAKSDIFACDIDNNGFVERYRKQSFGYPNEFLILEMEEREEGMAEVMIPHCCDKSGRQIMMWVDVCDGKNIMNVLYETVWFDYIVEGFLLDDTGNCSRLYAIEGKTELEMEVVRTREWPETRS